MSTHELLSSAPAAAIGAACGFVLGLAYFTALWHATEVFAAQHDRRRLVFWAVLRMLVAAGALAALGELGPAALLAALLGFVLARSRLLRRHGTARAARTREP